MILSRLLKGEIMSEVVDIALKTIVGCAAQMIPLGILVHEIITVFGLR